MEQEFLDKARGMLWGLVVGDCLGSPIQFTDKDDHVHVEDMLPCDTFGLPAGYWTDDSSMAFCIMDSYIRKGGYDVKDIADTFVKWLRTGYLSSTNRAFDVGNATESSLSSYERTGSLRNGTESSQGNGSIMRFAPGFLISMVDFSHRKINLEISDITHHSGFVRRQVDRMECIMSSLSRGIDRLHGSPDYDIDRSIVPNGGWCKDTIDAACWAFANSEDFESGMIKAVNLGGDADTIGAVYGQVAGAFYGVDSIPRRWINGIHDKGRVNSLIEGFLTTIMTAANH